MTKKQGFYLIVLLLSALAVLYVFGGCGSTSPVIKESGEASFYGDIYEGKKTANGERFSNRLMTAAHRELPFGTLVLVVRVDSVPPRSVIVRINDRGPYVSGRIIDLSRRAADLLGFVNQGHCDVEIYTIPNLQAR